MDYNYKKNVASVIKKVILPYLFSRINMCNSGLSSVRGNAFDVVLHKVRNIQFIPGMLSLHSDRFSSIIPSLVAVPAGRVFNFPFEKQYSCPIGLINNQTEIAYKDIYTHSLFIQLKKEVNGNIMAKEHCKTFQYK